MGILKTFNHSFLAFLNKKESIVALDKEISFKDAFLANLILISSLFLVAGFVAALIMYIISENFSPTLLNIVFAILFFLGYLVIFFLMFAIISGIFHLLFKLFGGNGVYLDTFKSMLELYVGYILFSFPILIVLSFISIIPIFGLFIVIPFQLFLMGWAIYIAGLVFAEVHKFELWKGIVSQIIVGVIFFIVWFIFFMLIMFQTMGEFGPSSFY